MTGSLIETPTLGDRTIADDRTRHHAPRARMDGWWPAAARIALSSANLQTRGAQPRTALTPPPFSWIDHLIRPLQERLGDGEPAGLGGLEVDDELELRGLFDREIAWFRALEDLIHVGGGTAKEIGIIRAISHQPAGLCKLFRSRNSRKPMTNRELRDPPSVLVEHEVYDQTSYRRLRHRRENAVKVVCVFHY